jgi:stress response protein SCP2
MDTKNIIVLIQLLIQYSQTSKGTMPRTFKFTKYNKMKVHTETNEELRKRKSVITQGQAHMLASRIRENLESVLKDRLGKVYIDPDMKNYALPIQENTSHGGYGVLTRGSRIHIGEAKKLRAFTYWEKVNDIDLSVFGIDKNGECTEFSWRTMAGRQSDAITYSGDETSGFNGGSEYFDIDTEKFRKEYPDMRYLVFCDNVYSRVHFNKCLCKAGYMVRDTEDSGAVYEPKTVKSAFIIDSDSVFAYLFGVDLGTNDFIWLNMARDSSANVAGTTDMSFITDYFNVTDVINVASFFEMMATEVVDDMSEADVIVTDKNLEGAEKLSDAEIIRDYDFEKLIALMNK